MRELSEPIYNVLTQTFELYVSLAGHTRIDEIIDGNLPCFECRGYGWEYDENDPPCPIEGNKCRRKINCGFCNTKGYSKDIYNKRRWLEDYKRAKNEAKIRLKEWRRTYRIARKAVKKLNQEELECLRQFPQLIR